jgi:hypothetical protein
VRPRYQREDTQSTQRVSGSRDEAANSRVLLGKVIAAKGGLERLRAVKNIAATTRATSRGPYAPQGTFDTVTYLEYPNRVRVESKNDRAEMVQVYDGTRAWVKDTAGTHDVPDEMVRDLEANLKRDTISALVAAEDGHLRTRLLPDAKDESGKLRHAIEFSGAELDPMVFYIDPETSLVVKQTYVAAGLGGPLVEEIFSDYRPVDGVQIAFATTVRVHGEPVLERTVTSFTINGTLAPTLFSRPVS